MNGRCRRRRNAPRPRSGATPPDQGSIDFAARRFVDLCQEYLYRFDPETRCRIIARVREINETRSWLAP